MTQSTTTERPQVFHPCDYETYRKIRRLCQLVLMHTRLAANAYRIQRKMAHNRRSSPPAFVPELACQRTTRKFTTKRTGPVYGQPIIEEREGYYLEDHWAFKLLRQAQARYQTQDTVRPLDATMLELVDEYLAKDEYQLSRWKLEGRI